MHALWITKHGGPEVLAVQPAKTPEVPADHVRIAVRACGLNFAEVTARMGLYPDAPKPPCVVGYEGAGVVEAVGAEVSGIEVGMRVLFMSRFGGMASMVSVPRPQVVPIGEDISFEHAAAIPVNYLTASQLLLEVARLRAGDRVLVHQAAGGVGTAALQLARTVPGVTVIGTASQAKHAAVLAQGADHVIDYRSEDYVERVRAITDGQGVDFVLDALGGKDWRRGYSLLREGGLLLCFGLANVSQPGKRNLLRAGWQVLNVPRFSPMKLMDDNRGVAGVNLGHMWHRQDLIQQGLQRCVAWYRNGAIKPQIDGIYNFTQAADAFARLEHGRNVGKVILIP